MLSTEVSQRLAALAPEPAAALHNISAMARQVADPALLALCADYIDAALQCRDWQPPGETLTAKQQAFIAFTEKFVTAVSGIGNADVARLLEFATADEVYAFVHALYVADMSRRLEIVGREVLA